MEDIFRLGNVFYGVNWQFSVGNSTLEIFRISKALLNVLNGLSLKSAIFPCLLRLFKMFQRIFPRKTMPFENSRPFFSLQCSHPWWNVKIHTFWSNFAVQSLHLEQRKNLKKQNFLLKKAVKKNQIQNLCFKPKIEQFSVENIPEI